MKHDIETREDIQQLVDTFYKNIQKDGLIGVIFMGAIKDWPPHLEKMYRFWETILLHQYTYKGSPFPLHASMPLEQHHFNRWMEIWEQTIDDLFVGDKAIEAKDRGKKMATMFLSKIEYLRDHDAQSIF